MDELILLAQHVVVTNMQLNDNKECAKFDELKQLLCQLVNFYSECNTDEIKVVSKIYVWLVQIKYYCFYLFISERKRLFTRYNL